MQTQSKRILSTVLLSICISFTSVVTAQQKKEESKKSKAPTTYRYNQFVMVTMKDGSKIPAIISSVKSKNKYWIRQYGGKQRGLVSKKFLRPMTKAEIAELKKSKQAQTKLESN